MELDILDAALGQPMQKGDVKAQTTISSTHQYSDRTMTEVLNRAQTRGWPVFEWCYRETVKSRDNPEGWLLESEIEAKRNEVTDIMWNVEYDLAEPNPQSRAIDPDKVKQLFNRELGEYEGAVGQYLEIEPPQSGGIYATGADWARKVHKTCIVTLRLDVVPWRLVAFELQQRQDWPTMIRRLDARMERYGDRAAHDATGLGDVIAGFTKLKATPVILAGREREAILQSYVRAIEQGELLFPYIRSMEQEHRLASADVLTGGSQNAHLPDTFSAAALAYYAGKRVMRVTDDELARYRSQDAFVTSLPTPHDVLQRTPSLQEILRDSDPVRRYETTLWSLGRYNELVH
jgi:hypothetical protein